MICLRPDIAQAVRIVSRYMVNSGGDHWKIINIILKYIKETLDVTLYYKRLDFIIRGYVDSGFVGDLDKKKSINGFVFTFAGGAVNYILKLQTIVVLSQ